MAGDNIVSEKIISGIVNLDYPNILGGYLINKFLDLIPNLIKKVKEENILKTEDEVKKHIDLAIENQIIEILNFSNSFQMYGLSEQKRINEHSVKLSISNSIKQFGETKKEKSKNITEAKLLIDDNDYLILGDPGAGKTTVLKRLIINLSKTKNKNLLNKVPVLIKLSEIKENETLFLKIAEILGIPYISKKQEDKIIYNVGEKPLNKFIIEIINQNPFIFFIDGLDEVKNSINIEIMNNFNELINKKTSVSKFIVTNRSGNFRTIERLNVCEIKDLDDTQIEVLAKKWFLKSEKSIDFCDKLNKTNYKTAARKPLFLVNLMMIYNEENNLPEKAIEIYNRLIQLLIWQWDKDRSNINRVSVFGSRFDIFKKYDFLKELSYHLLYRLKTIEFSNNDLKNVYDIIHKNYGLNENSQEIVIREIESHNGLVIKIGFDKYRFFHLTIQEYLCAEYLMKLSKTKEKFHSYILNYPEPIGISVALSPDSSDWLAYLIFMYDIDELKELQYSFSKIIYRACIEAANFQYSIRFGFALLLLMGLKPMDDIQNLYYNLISNNTEVLFSIKNVLIFYEKSNFSIEGSMFVSFHLISQPIMPIEKKFIQETLIIPTSVYSLI